MNRMRSGFTLLEVMVATVIMAIAVTGLLTNLRTSLTNAARLTDYDRAVGLARRKMDDLLLIRQLPIAQMLEGRFEPELAGGLMAGWRARVTPFETSAPVGTPTPPTARIVQRIQMEVWWMNGSQRRFIQMDSYRGAVATPQEGLMLQSSPIFVAPPLPPGQRP
jgi:general secretion pathway protein I